MRRTWARKVSDLKNLVEIQGSKGNWNHSLYLCGMFNGMELALSIMEERQPIYRIFPKKKKAR